MAHLVHNVFYELAVFQGHKLFFDNIYWSYSFPSIVGVFYLDFNRHDIQIDKTRRLFPDRTISSPPSNAWQFALQHNQSTVIMNAITDVIKRSTWIHSKKIAEDMPHNCHWMALCHISQCFYEPQEKTNYSVPLERIGFHECKSQRKFRNSRKYSIGNWNLLTPMNCWNKGANTEGKNADFWGPWKWWMGFLSNLCYA